MFKMLLFKIDGLLEQLETRANRGSNTMLALIMRFNC